MQYFVVIEDTEELYWQFILLYESITLLDLADHFLAAVCPVNNSIKHNYPNSIYSKNRDDASNKALSLREPFVLLKPHMFLLNPLSSSQFKECSLFDKFSTDVVNYQDWLDKLSLPIDFSFNFPVFFKKVLEMSVKDKPNVAIMQMLVKSCLTKINSLV